MISSSSSRRRRSARPCVGGSSFKPPTAALAPGGLPVRVRCRPPKPPPAVRPAWPPKGSRSAPKPPATATLAWLPEGASVGGSMSSAYSRSSSRDSTTGEKKSVTRRGGGGIPRSWLLSACSEYLSACAEYLSACSASCSRERSQTVRCLHPVFATPSRLEVQIRDRYLISYLWRYSTHTQIRWT